MEEYDVSRAEASTERSEEAFGAERPKLDCLRECMNDAWDLKSESECTSCCEF